MVLVEQVSTLGVAVRDGDLVGRVPVGVDRVRACRGFEQQLDHVVPAVQGRVVQRRVPLVVAAVDRIFSAVVQQVANAVRLPILRRTVERGAAVCWFPLVSRDDAAGPLVFMLLFYLVFLLLESFLSMIRAASFSHMFLYLVWNLVSR